MGWVFVLVSVAAVVTDLLTKWLAFSKLDPFVPFVVIPGLLNFRRSLNLGGVFGLGQGMGAVFVLFTEVASVVLVWVACVYGLSNRLLGCALALLLGGALGNLWDRLVHESVRDFIDVYAGSHHWPTFNVADIAICAGCGLIILHSFRARSVQEEGKAAAEK